MRNAIKRWQFWLVACLAVVVCFTITGSMLRFPIGLGMLRVAFLVAEQFWTKIRI